MYGTVLLKKNDNRNLLLDYVNIDYPMRKNFSSVGTKEILYSILEEAVVFKSINATEL
jgi:NADH:ubiquinone oxidoreductase subunit C